MIRTDFREVLRVFIAHDVEFILVGALSAVLQGAPIMTIDVDIVHQRDPANIRALLSALGIIDAHFRGHPGKKLRPTPAHLASPEHQLLNTTWGPLDLLGAIEHGLTYEQLLDDSVQMHLEDDLIQVLSLEKYVALKEESTRPKDLARLPVLREALSLQRREDDS